MLNRSPLITDLLIRLETEYGQFDADEWPRFMRFMRLRVERAPLPRKVPAMICEDVIVVADTIADPLDIAWWVWHEGGHWLLHEGERDDWMDLPDGKAIVRKYERQVNEFAARYPRWPSVPRAAREWADMFVIVSDTADYP